MTHGIQKQAEIIEGLEKRNQLQAETIKAKNIKICRLERTVYALRKDLDAAKPVVQKLTIKALSESIFRTGSKGQ